MSSPVPKDVVLFIDDVCRELRVNRRTVERLRRHGAFPIRELRALDKRPRWSRAAVDAYLADEQSPAIATRRRKVGGWR